MTDQGNPAEQLVVVTQPGQPGEQAEVESPAKVLRIGSMTKELLEEVRRAPLDEAGRIRLREIYETSVRELADVLSGDLRDELSRLSLSFGEEAPSEAELRVAEAHPGHAVRPADGRPGPARGAPAPRPPRAAQRPATPGRHLPLTPSATHPAVVPSGTTAV